MPTSVRASIPITDETAEGSCTQYYEVRFKKADEDVWTNLIPNPIMGPIVLEHLAQEHVYNVEITRVCCNGERSTALAVEFTTPATA